MNKDFILELVSFIKKEKPNKDKLNKAKIRLSKKYKLKGIPNDIAILLEVDKKNLSSVKKYLMSKETRTLSGVAI